MIRYYSGDIITDTTQHNTTSYQLSVVRYNTHTHSIHIAILIVLCLILIQTLLMKRNKQQ